MTADTLRRGPNKNTLYRFLPAILFAFGLFFIIASQYEINRAGETADWIPREAKITYSGTTRFGGSKGGDVARYVPEIKGVFLDTGEEFDVFRVSVAETGSESLPDDYTRRFSEGMVTQVYVSPTDPDKVVLTRDVPLTRMYILQTAGGILIILAVYLLLKSRKL